MKIFRDLVVGVDEVGRGPLCGPLVACAFYFKKKINKNLEIKDSKKTNSLKREEMFDILIKRGIFSLAVVSPSQIDRLNILEATMLAFNRAIKGIIKSAPFLKEALFVIDGNIFKTNLKVNYICIEKADEKIREVASASIIAKVFRDYLMDVLDFLYPHWGLAKHKGYPTRLHKKLLKERGITPFHRRSFLNG